MTVRDINLVPKDEPQQIDLFTDMAYLDRLSRLDAAVEEIRRRFGKRATFSALSDGRSEGAD